MDNRVYLEFREGTSDKFYRIVVTEVGGQWITNVWYGRRGNDGVNQVKYIGPYQSDAIHEMNKIANQKRAKGYTDALDPLSPAGSSSPASPITTAAGLTAAYGGTRIAGTAFIKPASPVRTLTIPDVPRFPAMKAREVDIPWGSLTLTNVYVMEEKFDGHRAGLTFNPDETIAVRNVYGEDKGRIENMPHIAEELKAIAAHSGDDMYDGTLIDGELVGLTLEETVHLLGAGGRSDPRLQFVAFDLPYLAGKDLRGMAWSIRRALLVGLLSDHLVMGGPIKLAETFAPSKAGVEAIWARGGEGAILKPMDSTYVPGGRADWVKVKEHHTAEAWISGWVPGKGKYVRQIGALKLSQFKGGVPTEVTQVSGMTDTERNDMTHHWPDWDGAVIEFEYQKKTGSGSYRHPRYVRPRGDKKRTDCTWEASA